MANSSYNTLYSTAQYKTIQKMTTALWIDVFCQQQSHSWRQPILQAQPHCNSVKTQKTINMNLHCCKPEAVTAVVSTAEFTNCQNYNEYYWKGCETFFLFVWKLMQLHTVQLSSQGVPIFLRHNTYISSLCHLLTILSHTKKSQNRTP
jgi:hypothetical protein